MGNQVYKPQCLYKYFATSFGRPWLSKRYCQIGVIHIEACQNSLLFRYLGQQKFLTVPQNYIKEIIQKEIHSSKMKLALNIPGYKEVKQHILQRELHLLFPS